MAKTSAPGARTGDTPPTPDNGNVDLNSPTGEPKAQTSEALFEAKVGKAEPQPVADKQTADPLLDKFEAKKADAATVAPGSDRAEPRKVSVSTTGDFMYQDPYTLEIVESEGVHEIIYTSAVQTGLDDGRLIEA